MTITAPIYNTHGLYFTFDFDYEIEGDTVIIKDPGFCPHCFGTGWQDDIVTALKNVIKFDFTLKIK